MVRKSAPFVCGIDAAIDVVGGRWKVLILWELAEGSPRRFAELRRALSGVSEKVLTEQLRELQRDGVVHRDVHPEVPPRVEYSLTPAGVDLNAALHEIGRWGDRHKARLEAARARTDRPAGA